MEQRKGWRKVWEKEKVRRKRTGRGKSYGKKGSRVALCKEARGMCTHPSHPPFFLIEGLTNE